MMWLPISTAPTDGSVFVALGDTEIATVWFEPEGGQRWKVRNIPGGAVRLADLLDYGTFHSWCRVSDLHKTLNRQVHPEYYLTGAEILVLEAAGESSNVHRLRKSRGI